jgi:hypothetical protein
MLENSETEPAATAASCTVRQSLDGRHRTLLPSDTRPRPGPYNRRQKIV